MIQPTEPFDTWLLHRVAQAVEAGGVSLDLLTELQAEFEAPRAKPLEQSRTDAVRDVSVGLTMPVEKVEAELTASQA